MQHMRNTNLNLNRCEPARASAHHTLKALLAYEDITVALQGQEVLRCLATELKPAFELRSGLWKFELLQDPELTEIATAEALEADMIIVATRGDTELPAPVASWIEGWVAEKRGDFGALIAVLGRGD